MNEPKLILSECREAMAKMSANSVDAIVTDPPYGLSFMGKEWDSFGTDTRQVGDEHFWVPDNPYGRSNVRYGWNQNKAKLRDSMEMFQFAMTPIFEEALRVAKPGAHLLAFGGTRTYHRLACAIEDAGWEVRDCIMWVYGCLSEDTEIATPQGWKKRGEIKAGDMVLAFDRVHGEALSQPVQRVFDYDYDDVAYRIVSSLTDQLVSKNHRVLAEVNGVLDFVYAETLRENDTVRVPVYCGDARLSELGVLIGQHKMTTARVLVTGYKGRMWCVSVPSGAIVARRNGKIFVTGNSGFPKSMDVSKAIDKALGKKREKVPNPLAGKQTAKKGTSSYGDFNGAAEITPEPASAAAAAWNGWGTQTKPACEPVVIAVKPYDGDVEKAINHLKSMEDKLCSLNVNDVGKSSRLSQAVSSGVKADSALASAPTPQGEEKERITTTGKVDAITLEAATSALAQGTESIVLNTISLWRRILEDAYALTNKYTTSMASSLTTDLKTWSCFLLQTTLADIANLVTHQSKLNASALLAENYFSAVSAKLNSIRTLTVAGNAISQNEISPHLSPIVVARKPLEGTVAANVLKYGTGAINIDGCRVGSAGGTKKGNCPKGDSNGIYGNGINGKCDIVDIGLGRFPANLIHDGSDEVLALFPDSKGQCGEVKGNEPSELTRGIYGKFSGDRPPCNPRNDSGSAARFFYCAKASRKERDGSDHPTMKPIALMRYLVRLVTRKGGVVLDPFMGSGTTGVAAIQEGMDFVGIERDPHYFEIARRRVESTAPGLGL